MSYNNSTIDDKLKQSGVAFAGVIPATHIRNVQKYLESKIVVRSFTHQTHLEWNNNCTTVAKYFVTEIKPQLKLMQHISCTHRVFVHFHECQEQTEIVKPQTRPGRYTVLIVVRPGPGFPLLFDGTHEADENSVFPLKNITQIPEEEGIVVIFGANIARKDPMVKSNGGSCILLAY